MILNFPKLNAVDVALETRRLRPRPLTKSERECIEKLVEQVKQDIAAGKVRMIIIDSISEDYHGEDGLRSSKPRSRSFAASNKDGIG